MYDEHFRKIKDEIKQLKRRYLEVISFVQDIVSVCVCGFVENKPFEFLYWDQMQMWVFNFVSSSSEPPPTNHPPNIKGSEVVGEAGKKEATLGSINPLCVELSRFTLVMFNPSQFFYA